MLAEPNSRAPKARRIRGLLAVPTFPFSAVEQAGAVMAALAAASAPLSALDIALTFKQGRKAELQVRATLAAMARMGFIAVHDSGTRFALRRAA